MVLVEILFDKMNIDVESLSEAFMNLLKENPALIFTDNGRIKCTLTNHEMPVKESTVLQHINAKKYKKLSKDVKKPFNLDNYKPHLEPNPKKSGQLICNLTMRYVNNQPDHVLRHVSGKRFLRAKLRWLECKKNGTKFVPAPLLNPTNRIKKQNNAADDGEEDGDEDFESKMAEFAASDDEEVELEEEEGVDQGMEAQKVEDDDEDVNATVKKEEDSKKKNKNNKQRKRKGSFNKKNNKKKSAKKPKKDNLIVCE